MSDEQQRLIERAEMAGVALTANAFAPWLNQLQHEGKALEPALSAIRKHGIEADEHVQAVLERPEEVVSRRRTAQLKKMLQGGEAAAAWRLFERLLEGGQAGGHQVSVMLVYGTHTSDERQRLIERIKLAGVALVPGKYQERKQALFTRS